MRVCQLLGAAGLLVTAACAPTVKSTYAHLDNAAETQIWIVDEDGTSVAALEPGTTATTHYARIFSSWFGDDVMRVARRDDGSVVTVCEQPECSGRRVSEIVDGNDWTTRIDDPSHDPSAFVDTTVDLRFSFRTTRKTGTMHGWIRTPVTNVTMLQTKTEPIVVMGPPDFVTMVFGALSLGAATLVLAAPYHGPHPVKAPERILFAFPFAAIGGLFEYAFFSTLGAHTTIENHPLQRPSK